MQFNFCDYGESILVVILWDEELEKKIDEVGEAVGGGALGWGDEGKTFETIDNYLFIILPLLDNSENRT